MGKFHGRKKPQEPNKKIKRSETIPIFPGMKLKDVISLCKNLNDATFQTSYGGETIETIVSYEIEEEIKEEEYNKMYKKYQKELKEYNDWCEKNKEFIVKQNKKRNLSM